MKMECELGHDKIKVEGHLMCGLVRVSKKKYGNSLTSLCEVNHKDQD